MGPKELVKAWVETFNTGDADKLAGFYAEDAINHQVASQPVVGRPAIREMFKREFTRARLVCEIDNLFEDGQWAILEWRDPAGITRMRFFQMDKDPKIAFQRGYWDQLSFLKLHGLPLET